MLLIIPRNAHDHTCTLKKLNSSFSNTELAFCIDSLKFSVFCSFRLIFSASGTSQASLLVESVFFSYLCWVSLPSQTVGGCVLFSHFFSCPAPRSGCLLRGCCAVYWEVWEQSAFLPLFGLCKSSWTAARFLGPLWELTARRRWKLSFVSSQEKKFMLVGVGEIYLVM